MTDEHAEALLRQFRGEPPAQRVSEADTRFAEKLLEQGDRKQRERREQRDKSDRQQSRRTSR